MSLRGERPLCIACETALELIGPRWTCEQCGSQMIPDDNVTEMMNQMSADDHRPIVDRLFPGEGKARQCPHCLTMMTVHSLEGVTVDRCPAHGIWFDTDELMAMLGANATAYAERNPSSNRQLTFFEMVYGVLGPWLARRRLRKELDQRRR